MDTQPEPMHERRHLVRVLVVADALVPGEKLREAIEERCSGCRAEVFVIAPALNSVLGHWLDDDRGAQAEASWRLAVEIDELSSLGLDVRGAIGMDDPVQAMLDALRVFNATEVIVVTLDADGSNWLEHEMIERMRSCTELPLTHIAA